MITNFNKVYNKLFNKYKGMSDIGFYKKVGTEDLIQDAVVSFLKKHDNLSSFESDEHLYNTMKAFMFNNKKSATHNKKWTKMVKSSESFSYNSEYDDMFLNKDRFIAFEELDVDRTKYLKLYLEGYTLNDIAERTGVSHMSVHRRIKAEMTKIL